jgi:purine nucleosidase
MVRVVGNGAFPYADCIMKTDNNKLRDIIIDTDIGDDIDDVLALAVATSSPEVNLLGVTTVMANAPRRAALAQHVLRTCGNNTRVVAGCSKALLQPYPQPLASQFSVLEDDTWNDMRHAVDFLIQAARVDEEPKKLEDQITLVPIGALTNVGIAIVREPDIVARLRVHLMGGRWNLLEGEGPQAEWNIFCDPEAAAIVFNSGIELSMVGLDVTMRCVLSEENLREIARASTRRAQLVSHLTTLYRGDNNNKLPVLHDPLAVLSIFSDCVQWENKRIEIGLCGDERGVTKVVEGEPNTRVAVDVDERRAVDLFMQRALSDA